jgi:hypothetical protein
MPPLPESEQLAKYIAEAQKAHGFALDDAWRAAIAEHYRRLLEAHQLLEDSGLDPAASEPAVKYEP